MFALLGTGYLNCMWLSILVFVVGVFAVLGGIVLGGPFTLVLVPLAVIGVVVMLGFGVWTRATGAAAGSLKRGTGDPLPATGHQNTAPTPSTPDDLVDARQQQQ